MKRIITSIVLITALFLIAACGNESADVKDLTLNDFIERYESEGIEVNSEEKPMFSLISAIDGVIFYVDNQPVKIYEYANEKDIEKGEEALPQVADWERNGKFVLETSNEKAVEIFKSVK